MSPPSPPPTGILAKSQHLATALARELNVKRPVVMSHTTLTERRIEELGVLLVEEASWPLSPRLAHIILPALRKGGGYLIRLERHDPTKWKKGL